MQTWFRLEEFRFNTVEMIFIITITVSYHVAHVSKQKQQTIFLQKSYASLFPAPYGKILQVVVNAAYKVQAEGQRSETKKITAQLNEARNDVDKAMKLLLKKAIDISDYKDIKKN